MDETWLTIEHAAVALGLSVRTVNRHITAGKIQSRLQDGRREVLVSMPDEEASAPPSDTGPSASPFAADAAPHDSKSVHIPSASPAFDPETVLALADNAAEKAELAISAYQALARSTDAQFRHVRRSARLAWSSVAVMAVGVAVAVGWTTHHLTRSHLEGQHLRQQVQTTSATADTLSAQRDTLRTELVIAREQAARAEGQVSAMSAMRSQVARESETETRADAVPANQPLPTKDAVAAAADTPADHAAAGPATRPSPTTRPNPVKEWFSGLLAPE